MAPANRTGKRIESLEEGIIESRDMELCGKGLPMSEAQPEAGASGQTAFPPPGQGLTLFSILKETARLYRRHWLAFTRVLLPPVGLMVLTFYGFNILLALLNIQLTDNMQLVQTYFWAFIVSSMLLALVSTALVLKGGWQYVVYWASLNRNAQEVIEQTPPDFKAAYRHIAKEQGWPYKTLVALYCALPLLACLPVIGAPVLGSLAGGSDASSFTGPLFLLMGFLLSGLLLIIWLAAAVFFSFIFQITAFEGLSASPAVTFLQSARLTLKRFWATLGLQAILLIATNYLLNYPIALLIRLLGLSLPLDRLHQWMLMSFLNGLEPASPLHDQAISMLREHLPEFASGLTDSLLMVVITALLLPLGTFAFTLLYQDIKRLHTAR
ncbi:MAG: hypothetical protein K0Q50_2939 [Vampirovibrio sp.]|nr:hypothetical protein [Vampirovibrio sp.]